LAVEGRTDGANAPQLTQMIQSQSALSGAADANIETRLRDLTTQQPIMMFMKGILCLCVRVCMRTYADAACVLAAGTPDEPRCGFSRKLVALLAKYEPRIEYGHFDILSDPTVRAALKEYAKWPTYPQLWVGGKLLGGLDVLNEMDEEAALEPLLRSALTDPAAALRSRLATLIGSDGVVLFMKGSPLGTSHSLRTLPHLLTSCRSLTCVSALSACMCVAPECGFSRKMCALLEKQNVTFRSFDILKDNDVRQGLKTYSNFPTFPQLYANGKLVGGLDIAVNLQTTCDTHTHISSCLLCSTHNNNNNNNNIMSIVE
jgi:glutaredoxin-related protein